MRHHDGAPVLVRRQNGIRPVKNARSVTSIFKIENDEIQSARAEQIEVTIIIGAEISTVIRTPAKM
jgi:hypothetical protein